MKIYTRRGDLGKTDLIGGLRVEKNDMRICCCGTVDELNCYLGVTIASCEHEVLRDILLHLQHELFYLGADLAKPLDAKGKAKRIEQSQIDRMEQQIDQATSQVAPMTCFILPGGSELSAKLHFSRAICRRAERLVVEAAATSEINPMIVTYLNRLSDLLFVLARWANVLDNTPDVPWDQEI